MDISKDFYHILEVTSDVSTEELKNSYRKLAKKYHPDSGASANHQMFQLVQSAWEILGNPDQRIEYDKKRTQDHWNSIRDEKLMKFQERGGSTHNFGKVEAIKPGESWSYPRVPSPLNIPTEKDPRTPSLIDRLKTIATSKAVEPLANVSTQVKSSVIPDQKYSLKVSPIDIWFGSSKELEISSPVGLRRIRVKIPKGINPGMQIKVNCAENEKFPTQNIQVLIELLTRPDIKIDGQDIIINLPISYSEVVLGEEITIQTPDGKIKVKIPANFELGKMIRIAKAGIKQSLNKGDLYIKPALVEITDSRSLRKILSKLDELYQGDIRAKLFEELEENQELDK